ncbi:fasciclin domain-containing protein [Aequorivita sp. Q41]|uniref:fasciclin domain-containing protein n=1 Tax=Aequorivita sp. Q41 TaxID=3153300 RepID=UPI0032429686
MQLKNTFLVLFVICLGTTVTAQKYSTINKKEITKEWEGATFSSTITFAENISEVPEFEILSKLLKNESLRLALEKEEMVTIFAFTDATLLKLSKKKRDSILSKTKQMNAMVKYLAVPGRVDSYSLRSAINKANGTTYLKTLDGQKLGVKEVEGQLQLFDADKRTAIVIASDFNHKNGFFHIIEGLIFPSAEE